jgi:hypothetical protein
MTGTSGRCGNIDYCSLADARQTVVAGLGMAAVCPECARPLLPPAGKAPGIMRPALAGIGVICLTGASIYMGLSNFHPARANALEPTGQTYAPVAQRASLLTLPAPRPIIPAALVQTGLNTLTASPGR